MLDRQRLADALRQVAHTLPEAQVKWRRECREALTQLSKTETVLDAICREVNASYGTGSSDD